MIPALREEFNRNFTPEKYRQFLRALGEISGTQIEFRVSETPCFVPHALLDRMAVDGRELVHQLTTTPNTAASRMPRFPSSTTCRTSRRYRCSCRWTSD